ncbi:MAG TPA: hypothetical protein VE591_13700 [Candidatus Acidoferrum sp.]|nr:hypothetical protein [Candidatus Acidoferrum sp.]
MRALPVFVMIFAAIGCTPGAPPSGGGGAVATTTIDVSLTSFAAVATAFGEGGGFSPSITTVALGSTVVFVNQDSFAHTSTSLGGATSFPANSNFPSSALSQSGTRLSTGWTSGNLAPGAFSQPLLADVPGTYLYGCFYHYPAPMRGAIVVH